MASDLISTALSRAARSDALVELFVDASQPHHFIVGLLSGGPVSGAVVFINMPPNDKPEGICVYKLSAITKIRLNTRYLAQLSDRFRKLSPSRTNGLDPVVIKRAGLPKPFQIKSGKTQVITIQTGKVGTTPFLLKGHLVALDRTCVCLTQLDSNGNEDGLVVCRKKYIDAIDSSPRLLRKPRIGAP